MTARFANQSKIEYQAGNHAPVKILARLFIVFLSDIFFGLPSATFPTASWLDGCIVICGEIKTLHIHFSRNGIAVEPQVNCATRVAKHLERCPSG